MKRTTGPLTRDDASRYPGRVRRTHRVADLGRAVGKKVTLAGRSLAIQADGFTLDDGSGVVRVLAPELPARFSIVEVAGAVETDADGAPVVRATGGRELVPALREPTAAKQWERFLLHPERRRLLADRARFLAETRTFFAKRGFVEVDTPALVAVPGAEPYLDPLPTRVTAAGRGGAPGYLITSPEYALKKLLVAGVERVFEISRCFRNGEPLGGLHNPEFLMLEWYRAYASYEEIMDDCEALLPALARAATGTTTIRARGMTVALGGKWERLSVTDAFRRYAAVDLERNLDADAFRKTLRLKGYRPRDDERYEDLFFRIFLNEIEPCLGRTVPTILFDYPIRLASLAKRSERDPRFAERFEAYVAGVEIANAFTELNDPVEQEARLREELKLRKRLGKTVFGPDRDFLDALRTGMPPSGGIALGLDRLMMLLLGKERIEEVRLFPAAEIFSFGPGARSAERRVRKRKKMRRKKRQ